MALDLHKLDWPGIEGITMLDPDDLQIDRAYQRFEVPVIIAKIVEEFDPLCFGVPCVAKRKGTIPPEYYVTDGQQRVLAARILKAQERLPSGRIPCLVHVSSGRSAEADLFLKSDQRRAISQLAKYVAGKTAGREGDLALDAFLGENGFGVASEQERQAAYPNFKCIGRVRNCYAGDADALKLALRIIRECWGSCTQEDTTRQRRRECDRALDEVLLWGLWEFCRALLKSPEGDPQRLLNLCKQTVPSVILRDIPKTDNDCRWVSGYRRGGTCAKKFAMNYNNRLPKSRRIEFEPDEDLAQTRNIKTKS